MIIILISIGVLMKVKFLLEEAITHWQIKKNRLDWITFKLVGFVNDCFVLFV